MTLAKRYSNSSHSVFNVGYHIVFCPKYRRKVLVNGVDERLKQLFQEKADEIRVVIERMEVMPDHVHLFIKSKPTYAIHFVVNQLKGYSSLMLRKEFPWLRSRVPTLWTRSYFVETIGHISEETVKRYIEEQKKV
jgi:putative transposase